MFASLGRRYLSYEVMWLTISLVPLLLIALLLPLTPHDYWWYLRLGHDVLNLGRVPSIDTYSFTQAGESVMNQPWLSAVIFWLAYNDGGLNLTFLLRAVCISAAYGILWVWMREMRAGTRLVSLLVILAGLSSSNNWSFRPQLFAYPLFSLSLFILWRWQRVAEETGPERRTVPRGRSGTRLLWALPIIAMLWANLHESFLLLFILEGAALIFGRGNRKLLLLVSVASFLATLITPYDIFLWVSLIKTYLANPGWDVSNEWLPPTNSGWQMNIFYAWVLLFLPLASFSKKRLSLLEWVWLVGTLWMAFSGVRYVIWGIFMLAGFSAHLLSDWDIRWLDRPAKPIANPILNYVVAGLLLLTPYLAMPTLRMGMGVQTSPPISTNTPVAATVWLSQHADLPGPMWSDLVFSSYLIFALPERTVWIDTRFGMVYTSAEYARYQVVASAEPGWDGILDRSGINLLMISQDAEPLLIETLTGNNYWCKMYSDPVAVIYERALHDPSLSVIPKPVFQGRLALQQRVLPAYRVRFFELLARACTGGLSLLAGTARPEEGIAAAGGLRFANYVPAHNLHYLRGPLYLCYQKGWQAWLHDWDPDALIVEANPRYLATPAAVQWMHARGRPVLGWGLGAPPVGGPLAGLRRSRRLHFLTQFDGLISYSRRGAQEYAAAGFPRTKIFVATNAVAPRPASAMPVRPPAVQRPTLLYIGRLQARKRVDFLLRACAQMPEPRPRLIIVGDGPERAALESLAKATFPSAEFAGAQHGEALKPYCLQADLFVLPGTGGLAVQEAMAYGLPVMVARGDGTQDDLVSSSNGWQIPAEDFPALVRTLQLALADVPRLRAMGAESYRIVSEAINLEKMVEVFVEALNASGAGRDRK